MIKRLIGPIIISAGLMSTGISVTIGADSNIEQITGLLIIAIALILPLLFLQKERQIDFQQKHIAALGEQVTLLREELRTELRRRNRLN